MAKYRRACDIKDLEPYLSEPIPSIRLKYFKSLTRAERREAKKTSNLICVDCGEKIAEVGSYNSTTGDYYCDNCAIDNYRAVEGFKTREAAEAHRRRLFDVGYLLTEMVADKYVESRGSNFEGLSASDHEKIKNISGAIWNSLPRTQKVALENNPEQTAIEKYFDVRLSKIEV